MQTVQTVQLAQGVDTSTVKGRVRFVRVESLTQGLRLMEIEVCSLRGWTSVQRHTIQTHDSALAME